MKDNSAYPRFTIYKDGLYNMPFEETFAYKRGKVIGEREANSLLHWRPSLTFDELWDRACWDTPLPPISVEQDGDSAVCIFYSGYRDGVLHGLADGFLPYGME